MILESKNAELPYVNRLTVISLFSYLKQDQKESNLLIVPEKEDKWKGGNYLTKHYSFTRDGKK